MVQSISLSLVPRARLLTAVTLRAWGSFLSYNGGHSMGKRHLHLSVSSCGTWNSGHGDKKALMLWLPYCPVSSSPLSSLRDLKCSAQRASVNLHQATCPALPSTVWGTSMGMLIEARPSGKGNMKGLLDGLTGFEGSPWSLAATCWPKCTINCTMNDQNPQLTHRRWFLTPWLPTSRNWGGGCKLSAMRQVQGRASQQRSCCGRVS